MTNVPVAVSKRCFKVSVDNTRIIYWLKQTVKLNVTKKLNQLFGFYWWVFPTCACSKYLKVIVEYRLAFLERECTMW